MSQTDRVAITGLGVLCPIGCHPEAILAALREGRSGIGSVTRYSIENLTSNVAGEVGGVHSTEQMAIRAAQMAWDDAVIPRSLYSLERVGLCVGASGAGLSHDAPAEVFRLRFQPHEQASAVAAALGIEGPVVMFSSASAGSGLALVHAMNLLRSRRCDLVIAGGAECLSRVNHESMDSMGLCSAGPCSPFSGKPGLTVGEGSAFFVLERLEDAISRQARVRVELFSFGVTQDAYDVVAGDPSGEGLARAFAAALNLAQVMPAAVDWIKANGTSNREQDASETLALKQVFLPVPPISALESFIGHANGASPALGLGLAVIAFEDGLLPATLGFSLPRAGCDLDYVTSGARRTNASCVLANSVGFGGSNVALLFGKPRLAPLARQPEQALCITGIGVVSPIGIGFEPFIESLRESTSVTKSGLVQDVRNGTASNRNTLLQRFALKAAEEAFDDAAFNPAQLHSGRIGLFVGLCRGSAAARSQYAAALSNPQARRTIGKAVLRMGRFTVASLLAQSFKLKGYGATISEGFGAGLHALAHASIHLQSSPAEDALLVVAADETGPGPARSLAEMHWLAGGHDGCFLRPYDPLSKGTTLSEGAVALVVERTSFAQSRGATIRAHIEGVGLSHGPQSSSLTSAIQQAMENARRTPAEISAVYGNGSGIWPLDEAELNGLREAIPVSIPLGCVNRRVGFAESASALFQVAASLHGLRAGEIFPAHQQPMFTGDFRRQLVAARTEGHRNAAVLLSL